MYINNIIRNPVLLEVDHVCIGIQTGANSELDL